MLQAIRPPEKLIVNFLRSQVKRQARSGVQLLNQINERPLPQATGEHEGVGLKRFPEQVPRPHGHNRLF